MVGEVGELVMALGAQGMMTVRQSSAEVLGGVYYISEVVATRVGCPPSATHRTRKTPTQTRKKPIPMSRGTG